MVSATASSKVYGSGEPILACLSYTFFSVSLTLVNKAIFSNMKLDFPWLLLGFQSTFVTLNLFCSRLITKKPLWKRELFMQMLVPSLFVTMYVFSSAKSLKYLSIPVITVIKSLSPICIAIIEGIIYVEPMGIEVYLAMTVVVFSNVVSLTNDLELIPLGYIWAFVNVFFNILYVLSLRIFLGQEYENGEKNLHSNLTQAIFQVPTGFFCGEVSRVCRDFPKTSLSVRALILLSTVLVTGIGHTLFWSLKVTSASTVSFVGGANKVLVVVLGTVLFGAKLSRRGWFGIFLGVVGSIWFAFAKSKRSGRKHLSDRILHAPDVRSEEQNNTNRASISSVVFSTLPLKTVNHVENHS